MKIDVLLFREEVSCVKGKKQKISLYGKMEQEKPLPWDPKVIILYSKEFLCLLWREILILPMTRRPVRV